MQVIQFMESTYPLKEALDLELTPELHREGLARELVRVIQDARKAAGLDVSDRVDVGIRASGQIAEKDGQRLVGRSAPWTVQAPIARDDVKLAVTVEVTGGHTLPEAGEGVERGA